MLLVPISFNEFEKNLDFTDFIHDEITQENFLYKALFVIVSYFCIGTELRFLAILNPKKYTCKDSEIWHAKAIHIAGCFLP